MASTVQPRECTINKEEGKGYGFFLRVEQDEPGHLVRSIEKGSSADKAGLKDGDRVMKVNGVFVDDKEHPKVVDLIKSSGNSVSLSVLDKDSYKKSKQNGVDSSDSKPPPYEAVTSKPNEYSPLKPRLCYLVKDKGSFGFSLKCIKGTTGIFLDNLAPGGAAIRGGVQSGDRIIEVNGKNIINDTYDQVVKLMKEAGDSVMFLLVDEATHNHFRNNNNNITADQATTRLLPNLPWIVELTKGSDGYGFYLRQEKNRKGHFIVEIEPNGPADKAKLKDFDRIVAVNGQSVEQMQHEQVVEAIRKGGNKTTLLISNKTVDDLYAKAGLSPFVYLKESKVPPPAKTETPKPVKTPSTKPTPTQPAVASAPQPAASTPDPKHKPKICKVQKGDKGFGFNLNAVKDVPGQYIKQIVAGGPADKAGIKEDDVLVEVNGTNVEKESYDDVIMRIKNSGGSVTLLLVSKEGSEYYKSQKIQITAAMAEPLPENKNTPNASQEKPPSKARTAPENIELKNQVKEEEPGPKQAKEEEKPGSNQAKEEKPGSNQVKEEKPGPNKAKEEEEKPGPNKATEEEKQGPKDDDDTSL